MAKQISGLKLFLFVLFLISWNNIIAQTDLENIKKESGYVNVNGLKMYNEIYGEGNPVILLHGSYMTINLNWGEIIPHLSKSNKVIAVEMQGHGHTADIKRDFSYEGLADDIAGLLNQLNIEKADIIGYSLGGTVALEFAIKHPQLIDKLVIISSVYKTDGWLPEVNHMMKTFKPEFLDQTPLKKEYARIAPDSSHWYQFVQKVIDFEIEDFNLREENIKSIKSPILFIMGDNDGVRLDHVSKMYKLCGGSVFGDVNGIPKSQLAILPGMSHVGIMMNTKQLLDIITPFLQIN